MPDLPTYEKRGKAINPAFPSCPGLLCVVAVGLSLKNAEK